MQGYIEKRALKKELSKEDVEALCKELMEVGIAEMGRYLAVCEIFKSNPWEDCWSRFRHVSGGEKSPGSKGKSLFRPAFGGLLGGFLHDMPVMSCLKACRSCRKTTLLWVVAFGYTTRRVDRPVELRLSGNMSDSEGRSTFLPAFCRFFSMVSKQFGARPVGFARLRCRSIHWSGCRRILRPGDPFLLKA